MKLILNLLFVFMSFLFSGQAMAGRAAVIVLEAPLLSAPSLEAAIVQKVRWGEEVYLEKSQLTKDSNQLDGFWLTIDRNGNDAYIPKQYVKVIYRTDKELESGVNRFSHDPTDYRLEEPLQEFYPLYTGEKRRIWFQFGLGTSTKANYEYAADFQNEEFISRRTFQVGYQKNISFDRYNRFYFGPFFHFTAEQAQFSFDNNTRARESRGQLGAGPFISYDIYRTDDHLFTLGGGFLLNWNRHLVTFATRSGAFEERLFNGISLSSKAQAVFQFREILPKLNLSIGVETELSAPHSLSPQTIPGLTGVWNEENDQIGIPLNAHHAFFLGVVSTY